MSNQDSNNNVYKAISTIVSSFIMKKGGFDIILYGSIEIIILALVQYVASLSVDFVYVQYLIYFAGFVIIVYIGNIVYRKYYKKDYVIENKGYLVINIQNPKYIKDFIDYVSVNKQYYNINVETNIGDKNKELEIMLHTINNKSFVADNDFLITQNYYQKIEFDDKYLEIKGYYQWEKISKEITDDKGNNKQEITFKYIKLFINKPNNITYPKEVFDKINNFIKTQEKPIKLNYIKIIKCDSDGNSGNHVVPFYEGKKETFEYLEEKFMKTLFHQDKDMLWSLVKNCCMHQELYKNKGQIGRISILLYGPPGTGKSSFAYRVAMCMQRHIISLDLRYFTKANLYQILQRPNESLCESYKKVVYLFEEFDISIKELKNRSEIIEKMNEGYLNSCDNFVKDEEYEYSKITNSDKCYSLLSNKMNEFTLRDLLEIFQGPVPFEEMILIANTNKYDEINRLCPELFRPGRMTPIYFGYITKDVLQDISMHYFNKKIKGYIPEILTIPTSQVIDIAFEAITTSDPFCYFSTKIIKLLDSK